MKKKTVGLALGAGGARGIAHVGVLEALKENDIPINYIVGSSMGGIIGGLYASGFSIEDMKKEIRRLKMLKIFDLDIDMNRKLGMLRGEKVKKLLIKLAGDKQIEETIIPFACTTVDVLTGEVNLLDAGSLVTAIRATSAIPGIFRPIEIDDMLCVDGGILDRVPCESVKKMGADVVIGVDVLGDVTKVSKPKNIIEMINRATFLMDNEICKYKNYDIADIMLKPVQDDVVVYSTKNLDHSYQAGRKVIEDNIDKIKEIVFGE